jgi:hypothetical protein
MEASGQLHAPAALRHVDMHKKVLVVKKFVNSALKILI